MRPAASSWKSLLERRRAPGDPSVTAAYDLIAIGSGPAGQRAALEAGKLGRRTALVERDDVLGGVSTNSGTLHSKTLRAAIVELTGRTRGTYAGTDRLRQGIPLDDLLWRTQQVIERGRDAIQDELRRNQVDVLLGTAGFVDSHTLEVRGKEGRRRVRFESVVIAVGTKPALPTSVEFDDRTVLDLDGLLRLPTFPRQLTVIGGSVFGLEYASMAAALGVHVTVIEKRPRLLDLVDDQISEALEYDMRGLGVVLALCEEVEAVQRVASNRAMIHLRSGKRLPAVCVLYAAGRRGAT